MSKIVLFCIICIFMYTRYVITACTYYYPHQHMGFYHYPSYYDIEDPDIYNGTMNFTAISPSPEAKPTEDKSSRRSCNIWCWIQRVGLFVVQQLLADNT